MLSGLVVGTTFIVLLYNIHIYYYDGPLYKPQVNEYSRIASNSKHESTSLLEEVDIDSKSTVSEHETTSPLEEEVRIVSSRIRDCLTATNMSDYFITNNYMTTAEHNARQVLESLRKIIPRFESKYDLPCWKMSLEVTLKSKPAKWVSPVPSNIVEGFIDGIEFSHKDILKLKTTASKNFPLPNSNIIEGSINGVNYSYTDKLGDTMRTLHYVHWSGNPPHISLSTVCLPKIFIKGYPKCGSSFLYCLIRNILSLKFNMEGDCQFLKEPKWWAGVPVRDTSRADLPVYLLNFEKCSEFVERNMPAVAIDATPNPMWKLPRYSEDETMENYCLMPSLIPVILPDSKYFVIMRNPITMLYSAFWFSCTMLNETLQNVKYKGPDIFHHRITRKLALFNNCKHQGNPLDVCVDLVAFNLFTPELPKCGKTRLEMSLYYFHTRKWLSVVPRERIHFFTMEELATQDITHTAKAILDHLELPLFSAINMGFAAEDLQNCNENTQHKIDYKHDPRLKMREDTKQILEEFFQPYNKMLADLLGDEKFLWE